MRCTSWAMMLSAFALHSWPAGAASLLPVPWTDHEYAEYRLRLHGGPEPGAVVHAVEPSLGNPKNIILKTRESFSLTWHSVEVDRDTMAPVSALNRYPVSFNPNAHFLYGIMETAEVEYRDNAARRTTKSEPVTLQLDPGTLDLDETRFVIRRLPLADGYSTVLPVLDSSTLRKITISVAGVEQVSVPAGEFRCFKVERRSPGTNLRTFWIADNSSRTLVKTTHGGSPDEELVRLLPNGPEPTPYHDNYTGLSLTAPPGWSVIAFAGPNIENQSHVEFMDPEGQATYVSLWCTPEEIAADRIKPWLETRPEWRAEERTQQGVHNFQNRPASVRQYPVTGGWAQSTTADYLENGNKKIELVTWFRTTRTRLNISTGGIDAQNLDQFARRFQPLVDSIRVP